MTQNDPIIQALKSKIELAIRDGHQHFGPSGEKLESAEAVIDHLLKMERVTSFSPQHRAIEKIDKHDFALPLENLRLTPTGELFVLKDKLLRTIN